MKPDQNVFYQIATSLANHFDSLFYVEIESGNYLEFVSTQLFKELQIPDEGEDFFALSQKNAHKYVHPDDLAEVLRIHEKASILSKLQEKGSYANVYRLVIDGKIVHIRHVSVLCKDKKHMIFCMENIDAEVREREEQNKILQSVQRMARRDELTGIKNKNAFEEYGKSIDKKIQAIDRNLRFGIVMCDVNDLKRINDTRGHSFGDEVLQCSSRMISDIFKSSQIYRIGGDEFVVVLEGEDYQIREELLENLKRESYANGRARSGPVLACGMSVFNPASDIKFSDVFKKADSAMYENKKLLKSGNTSGNLRNANAMEIPISDERKRKLDSLFGAFFTIAGDGYVYLNDLRYDYSRWSLPFVDDFGIESEYMYHAGKIWQEHVHPDDLAAYKEVIDGVIQGTSDMMYLHYRARKADGTYVYISPRAFILNDGNGNPEYFGGILIPQ